MEIWKKKKLIDNFIYRFYRERKKITRVEPP